MAFQFMEFAYLIDHPHLLPVVAAWHHDEWAYIRPGDTLEQRQKRLAAECGHCQIPTTVVALKGDSAVGSISLLADDMDTHPHLTPWLASLYVPAEHRRQGIGAALVARLVCEVKALKIARVYLYTPSEEKFYRGLGWKTLEQTTYAGKPASIMAYDIPL
jgi:GNAT superfamily N-acetyltransferase